MIAENMHDSLSTKFNLMVVLLRSEQIESILKHLISE